MSPQSNLVLIRIILILFVQSTCNKVKGLRARSYKKVTKKILSCKTNPAEPILLGKLLPGDDERDDGESPLVTTIITTTMMMMTMIIIMIMMVMKAMMLMMTTVTCMTCEPKVTRHKILRLTLPATELHKADYRDHNENHHHDCYHEKMTFAVMITTKENPHLPPMAETTWAKNLQKCWVVGLEGEDVTIIALHKGSLPPKKLTFRVPNLTFWVSNLWGGGFHKFGTLSQIKPFSFFLCVCMWGGGKTHPRMEATIIWSLSCHRWPKRGRFEHLRKSRQMPAICDSIETDLAFVLQTDIALLGR